MVWSPLRPCSKQGAKGLLGAERGPTNPLILNRKRLRRERPAGRGIGFFQVKERPPFFLKWWRAIKDVAVLAA